MHIDNSQNPVLESKSKILSKPNTREKVNSTFYSHEAEAEAGASVKEDFRYFVF